MKKNLPKVFSLEEIMTMANASMDKEPILQGADNSQYRNSYLLGYLKSSYQALYQEYSHLAKYHVR